MNITKFANTANLLHSAMVRTPLAYSISHSALLPSIPDGEERYTLYRLRGTETDTEADAEATEP